MVKFLLDDADVLRILRVLEPRTDGILEEDLPDTPGGAQRMWYSVRFRP